MTCALHNGITEAANIGFVALALAWTTDGLSLRRREPPAPGSLRQRSWLKAGAGVGLATLASPYLGLAAGLAVATRTMMDLGRDLQGWLHATMGAAVALLISAPTLLAMGSQLGAGNAIIRHPSGMNEQLALHNAVDIRTFFVPGGFRSADLSAEGFEHSMYLGLVALTLALGARRWRWIAMAGVIMVLSLGPYLYWGDGWVLVGESRLRLPFSTVQSLVPGLALTHPLRLAVPVLCIVAGLAAVGATTIPTRLSRVPRRAWLGGLGALLLLDGLWFSGAPWPIATASAQSPLVHQDLTRSDDEPLKWGILDLPTDIGATMASSRYLVWQASHRRPIPYAPDARASTAALL
ncbi:MAG: hypothetical protein QGG40_20090, partial [Myxococcota bacterium]|nr:hypothetical protein [Myxococcota bacterium]